MSASDTQQQATSVCAVAGKLLDAGMLDEATTALTEILGSDDSTSQDKACAAETLSQVRTRQVQRKVSAAQFFSGRKEYDLAATKLLEALALDPQSEQLRNEYASLPSEDVIAAEQVFAQARALADFGLHSDARDLLATYLKESGEPPIPVHAVPTDLQYLSGGKIGWWRNLHRNFLPYLVPTLEIAAAVIVLVIFLYLLIRSLRAEPMLRIQVFDTGGFEEEHFGAYFSNNLLSRLHALTAGQSNVSVSLIEGPIEQVTVPQEIEAVIPPANATWLSPVAWARAIPALINWIFPRRIIQISGELHSSGNRGVGATVRLVEKQKILVGYALWEEDFDDRQQPNQHDDEENLYQLSEYVAVWLLFDIRNRFSESAFRLLGTTDWRAYACFRAGCFADNDGRAGAAHNLYIRALRRDPCLRAARVNLGLLYIRDKKYDAALEQLQQVREEAQQLPGSDRDPTLYLALYNIAAIKSDRNKGQEAIADIRELLRLSAATFGKIESEQEGYRDPNLRLHLDSIVPAADTMLGGLMVEQGDSAGLKIIERQASRLTLSDRHQFNLACSYSILAGKAAAAQPPDDEKAKTYLDCAHKFLKRAFQISSRSVRQAKDDPKLQELRDRRPAQFEALLHEFEVLDEPEPDDEIPLLASISTIGETHAMSLAELDITTVEELREKTMGAADRKELEQNLTVSPRIITRWAHAADLLRIAGLGVEQLNLLAAVPVTTINELATCSPQALADDLAALAAAADIDPPGVDRVRRWVEHAGTTTLSNVT